MENPISARRAPRVIVDARRPALLPLVLAFVLLLCWSASFAVRGDWYMCHHDPQHTGRSPFVGPATPTKKWAFTAADMIYSSSAAIGGDGTIYVGSFDQNLYAVTSNGARKWAFNTGETLFGSPAIATDGTIYIGSLSNKLYAINPDGTVKWVFDGGKNVGFYADPTIGTDGTIYIASGNNLYAINPDGTKRWAFATGIDEYSSPAIAADGTLYFQSTDGKLYAINPNGTKKWSFTTNATKTSSPTVGTDGTIYLASFDSYFYAVNADGTLKWSLKIDPTFWSSPALGADGTLYIGSMLGTLYAINPNGAKKWTFATGGCISSSPIISADGTIYIGSRAGYLYAVNPDGTKKWAFATNDLVFYSTPAIGADGTVYFGLSDGHFYAIGGAPTATVTVTPTAGANGTITPSSPQSVTLGTNLTVTAAANAGYTVDSWTLDGVAVQSGAPEYTVTTGTMTSGSTHTVKATFKTVGVGGRGDWWMFGHDPQHTGRSPFVGPAMPYKKWAYPNVNYMGFGAPVIGADGTIYHGSEDYLHAVNPNGTRKWALRIKNGIALTPAIGMDGTIYVGVSDHILCAINPDGTKKWAFTGSGMSSSSPVIGTDGTIYIGSTDYNLYAINPDGTEKWRYNIGDWIESSPALGADGTIYIQSLDNHLYAINRDGTRKWSFPINSLGDASPTVGTDGTIYAGSGDGNLDAVNPNGTRKWACKTGSLVDSTPAIGADGTIYVGLFDGHFIAINPNGTKKWTFATGYSIYAPPTIGADGTIYIGSTDSNLYAVNPDGTKMWSFATQHGILSSPALGADGTLYLEADDGYLYAIGGKPTATVTVTPTAGANGTISPSSPQPVAVGSNLTFTAAANAGYTVDSWTLDNATAQSGGTQYTLSNITANHAVKVTFKALPTYTLTPSVGSNGVITPNTPQTVLCGANFTFIAAANAGYTVDSWYLDNARTQNGGTQYPLANVTANHTLLVIFKALPSYFITPSAGPNGTITPSSAQMVTLGANLTLTATAYAGYTVDSWALDSVLAQTGGAQFALKNITASHLVRVTFKIVRTAIVTPTAGPNGAISPSTPQTVVVGANLSFTAAANAGYTVDCWTCSSTVTQTGGTQYTLSNITAACTVKVTFKKVLFYTVTPTAGTNGTISPPTAQTVTAGSNLSFTATANAGYTTDSWSLDGSVAQTGGTQYTVNNITANHALTVTFKSYATYQPDLALCNNGEAGYTGLDIFNLTGVNQTKSQTVAAYTTATYNFQLKNAGHLADSFLLACSSVDMGWHVQVIECATGNDVTAAFVSQTGNRTATLSPGSIAGYILHLMPYSNAKPLTLALTASSVGDTTKKDVVKVVTSKQ